MISAEIDGRIPYMTYPEPWRGPPKQPPEFLRPAPKPIPPCISRYNGATTTTNGMRLTIAQQTLGSFTSPQSVTTTPINLTQHKDELVEELPYYRLYTTSPHISHFPQYTTMYQNSYTHPSLIRSTFHSGSLQSLESYSPTTPPASSTFLSPSSTFSPPSPVKNVQNGVLREKKGPNQTTQSTIQLQSTPPSIAFKVPTGKEGSLKHRILTRPEDIRTTVSLDSQKFTEVSRRRLSATLSPPRSPKKLTNNNNSNFTNFVKGSLIQLANGELRKIEDMRTEDFVLSAEHSPALRLAESTVVRLEEHATNDTAAITLSYNQRRTQVEFETNLEHPFFVFGQGWASCNPEKTLQCFRLKVHRLQVGDIIVSLMAREIISAIPTKRSTTILTTATSTAMTVRPLTTDTLSKMQYESENSTILEMQPINLQTTMPSIHTKSPEYSLLLRKRSASDQICDDEKHTYVKKSHNRMNV